eukprot:CAMPEP_0119325322 /NCGR_PEP_ID=MMETSP1333-20130426/65520_1 /TAXON_ID=418940 /ORGANISM="Scyphosphaera apsteinii, Strain RCC1455" /LENGTH=44 /DNA_ID= /DNA_START= /DNA_END= /DNA_ORIENTATION=
MSYVASSDYRAILRDRAGKMGLNDLLAFLEPSCQVNVAFAPGHM